MRAKPSTHLPILRGRSFAAVLVLALAAAGVSAHDDEKDSLRSFRSSIFGPCHE